MSPNMKVAWGALGFAAVFNALQYAFPDRALELMVPVLLCVAVAMAALYGEVRR